MSSLASRHAITSFQAGQHTTPAFSNTTSQLYKAREVKNANTTALKNAVTEFKDMDQKEWKMILNMHDEIHRLRAQVKALQANTKKVDQKVEEEKLRVLMGNERSGRDDEKEGIRAAVEEPVKQIRDIREQVKHAMKEFPRDCEFCCAQRG